MPKADNITTILGHCHVIWEQLPGAPWAPSAFEIWELQLPGNPNVCPGIALPSLHTKVVPKAMSNVFFLHANREQQKKESMLVDGTSCCVILECLVTSIAASRDQYHC